MSSRGLDFEDGDVYISSHEQRFRMFSSVEYEGQLYMTPQNFIESVTMDEPKSPPAPAPEHTLALPVVATEVEQQEVVMSEEEQDALSLVASWDEESFLQTETQDPDLTQNPFDNV
ncbi:UNVERIFIED_CONTAM: hypothetical protein FKN15_010455 [Acipenser sinensis]